MVESSNHNNSKFYLSSLLGDWRMERIFSANHLLQIWITIEVELAEAQELYGVIPQGVAQKIKDFAHRNQFDYEKMIRDYEKIGFPVLPFITQLANACDGETARWVHYGATTQDIVDTGLVLQCRGGLTFLEQDIGRMINALVGLANQHRDTVMAGRTFQQLAAPITFGYKAAIWLAEILRHQERLDAMKPRL